MQIFSYIFREDDSNKQKLKHIVRTLAKGLI